MNKYKLINGSVIVYTQAGFAKALKEFRNEYNLSRDTLVKGYFPFSYPSIVTLGIGYCGEHYITLFSCCLNDFIKDINHAELLHTNSKAKLNDN